MLYKFCTLALITSLAWAIEVSMDPVPGGEVKFQWPSDPQNTAPWAFEIINAALKYEFTLLSDVDPALLQANVTLPTSLAVRDGYAFRIVNANNFTEVYGVSGLFSIFDVPETPIILSPNMSSTTTASVGSSFLSMTLTSLSTFTPSPNSISASSSINPSSISLSITPVATAGTQVDTRKHTNAKVIGGVIGGVLPVMIFLGIFLWYHRRRLFGFLTHGTRKAGSIAPFLIPPNRVLPGAYQALPKKFMDNSSTSNPFNTNTDAALIPAEFLRERERNSYEIATPENRSPRPSADLLRANLAPLPRDGTIDDQHQLVSLLEQAREIGARLGLMHGPRPGVLAATSNGDPPDYDALSTARA